MKEALNTTSFNININHIVKISTLPGAYRDYFLPERTEIELEAAIKAYLEHLKASCLAANTIYCYSEDLKRLLDKIGNIKLNLISGGILDKHLIQLRETGLDSSTRSIVTMNKIKSVYRSFFKWCFIKGFIDKDFTLDIRLVRSNSMRTIPINPEEISALLNTISTSNDLHSQRDKALFSVYAYSGIRRAEALALRISDYDGNAKILSLPKAKGGAKKIQPIPSILSFMLDEYLDNDFSLKHSNCKLPLFPGNKPEDFLSGRQAGNRFDKWKRIAGIRKNLTTHSFRASYATQLYRSTKDPLLVSHLLGHRSVNTTTRYIKEGFTDIGDVLEKAFSPNVNFL